MTGVAAVTVGGATAAVRAPDTFAVWAPMILIVVAIVFIIYLILKYTILKPKEAPAEAKEAPTPPPAKKKSLLRRIL